MNILITGTTSGLGQEIAVPGKPTSVTVSNNKITVQNETPIGDYIITLTNTANITNLSDYSTFA